MELTKRQKEIINTSSDLIATGGIQNFTMKSLSKDIGISEPAIYRHFIVNYGLKVTSYSMYRSKDNYIIIFKF